MKRKLCMALSALMMVSGMAGFGIVAGASDGDVTLRYGIWDDNQKAALREIADKFEEENPGIKVEIEVTPWKDYWTTLETSATGCVLDECTALCYVCTGRHACKP